MDIAAEEIPVPPTNRLSVAQAISQSFGTECLPKLVAATGIPIGYFSRSVMKNMEMYSYETYKPHMDVGLPVAKNFLGIFPYTVQLTAIRVVVDTNNIRMYVFDAHLQTENSMRVLIEWKQRLSTLFHMIVDFSLVEDEEQ